MATNQVDGDVHEFLFDRRGELRDSSTVIPDIREHIQNLPKTASTFKLNQIDDVYPPSYEDIHLEFCESWRVHEMYEPSRDRVYVNPNYSSVHQFTDLVVECECGARLTRNYDSQHNSLRNEHEHNEDCQPFHRLRARADMAEMRYRIALRCGGKLGWSGNRIARRMGVKPTSIGQTLKHYDIQVKELRDEFRETAARTYRLLTHKQDESGQMVADIYGVTRTTMGRWCNKYLD